MSAIGTKETMDLAWTMVGLLGSKRTLGKPRFSGAPAVHERNPIKIAPARIFARLPAHGKHCCPR